MKFSNFRNVIPYSHFPQQLTYIHMYPSTYKPNKMERHKSTSTTEKKTTENHANYLTVSSLVSLGTCVLIMPPILISLFIYSHCHHIIIYNKNNQNPKIALHFSIEHKKARVKMKKCMCRRIFFLYILFGWLAEFILCFSTFSLRSFALH